MFHGALLHLPKINGFIEKWETKYLASPCTGSTSKQKLQGTRVNFIHYYQNDRKQGIMPTLHLVCDNRLIKTHKRVLAWPSINIPGKFFSRHMCLARTTATLAGHASQVLFFLSVTFMIILYYPIQYLMFWANLVAYDHMWNSQKQCEQVELGWLLLFHRPVNPCEVWWQLSQPTEVSQRISLGKQEFDQVNTPGASRLWGLSSGTKGISNTEWGSGTKVSNIQCATLRAPAYVSERSVCVCVCEMQPSRGYTEIKIVLCA
jgi:hypothetical protein